MAAVDEEFDFVVVGSGGGSMCAGLVMRNARRSVVILEKMSQVGGTTARAGGVLWIPNNRFMREDGVTDSYEQAVTYLESTAGQSKDAPGASPARLRAYAAEGTKMIDFLVGQGIKLRRIKYWPDYYDDRPGGSAPGRTVVAELFNVNELGPDKARLRPNTIDIPGKLDEVLLVTTHKTNWVGKIAMVKIGLRGALAKLTGKHWVANGAALQGRMFQASLGAKVDIRANSPVASFIVEDGAVKGVVTVKDGREWRVGARLGVLVNAGGFAHNEAMRVKYGQGGSAKWTATSPGDTGEMILEMEKIGAAIAQMDEFAGNQMSIPPGRDNQGEGLSQAAVGNQADMCKPHSIVVDQSGVRYCNEAGSYMEFCQTQVRRNREVPAIPAYWIIDARYMEKYFFCGTWPGSEKPKEWYDSGYLKRADTIEGLAGLLSMDPATLKATVERFNGFARAGRDDDFKRGARAYDRWLGDPAHKPSPALGTLEKPPFYAAPVVPGDIGTWGGAVSDEHARVLRADGSVIPGLYATGVSTAGVAGRYYVGPGSSIGPSFVWGYTAAKHAAGLNR